MIFTPFTGNEAFSGRLFISYHILTFMEIVLTKILMCFIMFVTVQRHAAAYRWRAGAGSNQKRLQRKVGGQVLSSMTGFGRYEVSEADRKMTAEIKSVNHRYCDINVKMPKKLAQFETEIRNIVKRYVQRGKVDVYLSYEDSVDRRDSVKYNKTLAGQYVAALRQMKEDFGLDDEIKLSLISRFPDVLVLEEHETDLEELWNFVRPGVEAACESLVRMRAAEGEHLREDLTGKLDEMLVHIGFIKERSPEIIRAYRAGLESRVRELLDGSGIDESRIAMETAIYADKLSIDEEIVRLESHIKATRDILNGGGAVGRKLDFIAQEMNREANTILSKANDMQISDKAIDLKTSIEKVREQIQNLE